MFFSRYLKKSFVFYSYDWTYFFLVLLFGYGIFGLGFEMFDGKLRENVVYRLRPVLFNLT